MKTCRKCNEIKNESEFHRNKSMRDGLCAQCKVCKKLVYLANRDLHLARYGRTNQKPERKAKNAEWCRRWYQKQKNEGLKRSSTAQYRQTNPEKAKAHSLVRSAIRNKTLIHQPCEKCGDARVHGHHADYTKPLDVQWLCAQHHAEAHHPNIEG